jgi:ClpP class serine protease
MTKPSFNLYEAATGAPWLMTEAALERVLYIIEAHAKAPDWRPDLAAMAKELGRPMENTQETSILQTPHGAVAVIPVRGPIFPHANSLHAISGATSIESTSADFATALKSEARGIILSFDSPGGAVSGVSEFANEIRNRTTKKPVMAYVEGIAASAAYWLASAADNIIAGPSAEVGSIGVVLAGSKSGAREYEFVSRQSPKKRPNPDTEDGKAQLVDRASDIAGVFIDDVAKYRGTTAAKVESDFGKGGMLVASKAKAAGMIDGVAHFADVLAKGMWVDSSPRVVRQAGMTAADTENGDMGILSKFFKGKEGESPADAEARLERLIGACGDARADFALAQHKVGNDVSQAVEALLAVETAKVAKLTAELGEMGTKLQAASDQAGKDAKAISDLTAKVKDMDSRPPTGKGMGGTDKAETADALVLAAMVNGANAK